METDQFQGDKIECKRNTKSKEPNTTTTPHHEGKKKKKKPIRPKTLTRIIGASKDQSSRKEEK